MNIFDNVYILKGSLTEEQAKNEIERIKQYFKNVEIIKNDNNMYGYLGLKKLAYKIRGEQTGHYYVTHFEGTENKIADIERQLRLNDKVIKFITIKL